MDALYAELLARIEKEIKQISIPDEPKNLYEPMRYILSLGGKRVRPVLTLLGAKLFSDSFESSLSQALAVEVFHNFTLLHDDMMDGAEIRRQVPTVHKKWDENIALLSGDGMLVLAYQLIANGSSESLANRLELFSKTAMEVCEGQQLDMDYALLDEVPMEDYLKMIRLKTAVLLSGSIKLGAMNVGYYGEQLEYLTQFTESMGLAFQVQDDYLDAFGGDQFGKVSGGDILEGKRTWLTIKAFELANDDQKKRLRDAYAAPANESRIKAVMSVYSELGIESLAQTEVESRSDQAIKALELIDGNADAKKTLSWLVNQLVKRKV